MMKQTKIRTEGEARAVRQRANRLRESMSTLTPSETEALRQCEQALKEWRGAENEALQAQLF